MYHWSEKLFKSPIEHIEDGWEDPFADYSFALTDIVKVDGQWYVVSTSGCSCPSYDENADIDFGPSTLEDLRVSFEKEYGNEQSRAYYESNGFYRDVIAAFDRAASVA